jgi:tetratricopeptide (TPR) repeat protein
MALRGGRLDQAEAHFMRSLELFEKEGRSHPAGRVSARLGEVEWLSGRLDEAVQRMEAALRVLVAEEPDEDLAALAVELGRAHFFRGDLDGSTERVETALDAAERLWLPEVISQALNTKGLVVGVRGHLEEGLGLVSHALKVALENGIHGAALRAYGNAADMLGGLDRNEEALALHKEALPLARRVGDRFYEWNFLSEMTAPLLRMGRWDEAMELAGEIPEEAPPSLIMSYFVSVAEIYVARGQLDEAGRLLDRTAILESSADVQEQGVYNALRAIVMRARGRHAEALSAGRHAFEWQKGRAMGHQSAKIGFVEGMEASLAMDDRRSAEQLLAVVTALPPGEQPPYLRAQAHRFRARLPSGPTEDAEQRFKGAAGMFRELGTPFWLAVTLLEHGEWLVAEGRSDHSEPLLAEAGRTFDQLMARPWLERLELVTGAVPAPR